jgi:putative transposase
VDQAGNVLDILVQSRRNKQAAKKFFRKLLKGLTYVPRMIITDKLKSSGAAKREILPGVEHRQHRYLNNRAGNSHQPTRQWERRMPSDSSRRMDPSSNTFAPDGICCLRRYTMNQTPCGRTMTLGRRIPWSCRYILGIQA